MEAKASQALSLPKCYSPPDAAYQVLTTLPKVPLEPSHLSDALTYHIEGSPYGCQQLFGGNFCCPCWSFGASLVVLVVKNLPANTGDIRDVGSIPGVGRSPGGGYGNPLQHSCLENPTDRGAWWDHGVAESDMTEAT